MRGRNARLQSNEKQMPFLKCVYLYMTLKLITLLRININHGKHKEVMSRKSTNSLAIVNTTVLLVSRLYLRPPVVGASVGASVAGPGLAGPGLAGPGLAGPGLAGPGLAGPGMAGCTGWNGSSANDFLSIHSHMHL